MTIDMANASTHCCEIMRMHLESGELYLSYIPKFREYGIHYNDGGTSRQVIHFCPWCGSKLPPSRRNEWFDELDRLGLDPDDELPIEFTNDAWWRDKHA